MKNLFTLSFILFSFFAKADYWTQKANFPGSNRFGTFSFSIGSKGYLGCGYDNSWATTNTFWAYDQLSNTWTQKANFGGVPRVYPTGFAIGASGYAGLGVDPAAGWMQDFWRYDTTSNSWTPLPFFGGGQRSEACSFVINGKAYVGTGNGVGPPYTFNDLWEFDPVNFSWTAKASMPGSPRIKALGLSAGNNGYIVTGFASTNYFTDIWEYNPAADSWTQKASFTCDPRGGAAGVSLFNKLFIGTGNNLGPGGLPYPSQDWWEFDPISNQWIQKNSYLGLARYETAYFTIDNKGYVGIGVNSNVAYNDLWEYTTDPDVGINEVSNSKFQFTVSPNPVKDYIIINYLLSRNEKLKLTITNIGGNKVYQSKLFSSSFQLPTSSFPKGVYFVQINYGKEKYTRKFLKE